MPDPQGTFDPEKTKSLIQQIMQERQQKAALSPADIRQQQFEDEQLRLGGQVAEGLAGAGAAVAAAPGAALQATKNLVNKTLAPSEYDKQKYRMAAKATKTAVGAIGDIIETPFRALKGAATAAQTGQPILKGAWNTATMQTPAESVSDITKRQFPSLAQDPDKSAMTDIAGMVGEFALDPAMYASGAGLTRKGIEAERMATSAPRLGQQLSNGERAVLTMGGKTVIPGGKWIGKPVEAAQKLIEPMRIPWRSPTDTPNAVYNRLLEKNVYSPESYAAIRKNLEVPEMGKRLEEIAKKHNMEPQQLNKLMSDYLEPAGSQAENLTKEQLRKINESRIPTAWKLPEEAKSIARAQEKSYARQQLLENKTGKRQFYQPHQATPEFQDWFKKTMPNENMENVFGGSGRLTGASIDATKARKTDMTVNEINNLALQGRLRELPNFKDIPEAANFKGKAFNDQFEEVAGKRFLQHVKVKTRQDFMNAIERTFGKDREAVVAMRNQGMPTKNYREVEGKHYPTEIANEIEGLNRINKNPAWKDKVISTLRGTKAGVGTYWYSIWPKSHIANAISNEVMKGMHGLWGAQSTQLGYELASRLASRKAVANGLNVSRLAKDAVIPDEVALKSPLYGNVTKRQLVEMAGQNRGIGMGITKSEFDQLKQPKTLLGKTLGPRGAITKPGEYAGELVEDAARISSMAEALKKGATWEGAAEASRKVNLDYGLKGSLDQSLSTMTPFYMFARKNLPRVLGLAVTNPGGYAAYGKARDVAMKAQGRENDPFLMDTRDIQGMSFPIGRDEQGQPLNLRTERFLPHLDPNKWLGQGKSLKEMALDTPRQMSEQALGMVTPFVKTPAELALNQNSFMHRPIQQMPGEVKNLFPGVNPPAMVTHLAKSIRPVSEASAFMQPGADKRSLFLNNLIGYSERPMDVEGQFRRRVQDMKKEMGDLRQKARMYMSNIERFQELGRPDLVEENTINFQKAKELALKRAKELQQEYLAVKMARDAHKPYLKPKEKQ